MSGGNRLYRTTLGACLATLLFVTPALAQQDVEKPAPTVNEGQGAAEETPPPKKEAAEAATKQNPPTAETTPPTPPVENKRPAEPPCDARCKAAENRQQDDLVAQQSMARAAGDLIPPAYWQVGLGFLGVFLIAVTLAYTRKAAISATKAAKAAQDTAYWIIRTEWPRLILKAIIPKGFENARNAPADDVPLIVAVRGSVENVGTRTAIILSVQMTHSWCLPSDPPEPKVGSKDWIGNISVTAGRSYEFPGQLMAFRLQFDESQLLFDFQKELFVYGFVRYADVHGTAWRTGFAFVYYPAEIGKGRAEGRFYNCGPTSYWYDVEEKRERH